MVVWSSICRAFSRPTLFKQLAKPDDLSKISINGMNQFRQMSGHGPRLMNITASRFSWHKFKDMLHFYTVVGLIPVFVVVFGANVFIGPATLSPTPEDYNPKHWEYHRHPISRFLSRYIYANPQQDYEKLLHVLYEEHERMEMRRLEKKIRQKMALRKDYQAFYYYPVTAKYLRISKEASDELPKFGGAN